MTDMGLEKTDVKWYEIQQKVFTRWVNDYLEDVGDSIEDLRTDFMTGCHLCRLLEVLSGKKIKHNKKPRMKFHKVENLGIAIDFLKKEGLRLVNIGPEDIFEENLRIILGLVWTIILRYEIKAGAGENAGANDLLEWVRSKIPEYDIKNFTKNWNDGRAVCALTNAMLPGLIPNHWDMKPEDKLKNAQKGLDVAWDRLKVDKLILSEEMVHPKVDKLAMMTYIAQFRNILPEHMITDASLCKAYGPGLEKGIVEDEATFTVEIPAEVNSELKIQCTTEDETCEVKQEKQGTKVICTYTPHKTGVHQIDILVGGLHIPNSTFNAHILEKEAGRCRAEGDGLVKGMRGETASFVVKVPADINKDGMLAATLAGPEGDVELKLDASTTEADWVIYPTTYVPTKAGEHRITVTWGNQPIPGSEFTPVIDERPAALCKATGEGLREGVCKDEARFSVEVPEPHDLAKIAIAVTLGEATVNAQTVTEGRFIRAAYVPTAPGDHSIKITYDNEDIPDSVFTAVVEQRSIASRSRAFGPGLEEDGVCDDQSTFYVEPPRDEDIEGKLVVKVIGPADEAKVDVAKGENGLYDVHYTPTTPGEYKVHVTIEDEHVPGSVFTVTVLQKSDAKRCHAFGPGLIGGLRDFESHFWVISPDDLDITDKMVIEVQGPEGPNDLESTTQDEKGQKVVYIPDDEGPFTVSVKISGEEIPGSPFVFDVDGPRGVVSVYFSTTTASMKTRSDFDKLEQMFYIKRVHLRPDFQPWQAMDMMDKPERDEIYRQAGVRTLPLVWIDDTFIGGFDEIEDLNECGELDPLLALHTVHLLTPEQHMKRLMGLSEEEWEESGADRTHFCGDCGYTKLKENKICSQCGSDNAQPFDADKIGKRIRMHNIKPEEKKKRGTTGKGAAIRAKMAELTRRKEEREREEREAVEKAAPLDLAQIDMDDFFMNCYVGDVVQTERMLKAGMDPNNTDENGNTPWKASLENKQDHMGALLVKYGARFEPEDFFIATYNGQLNLVKEMVKKGMPVNIQDEEGSCPLGVAVEEQHGKIVRFLRKNGAKLPGTDGYKQDHPPAFIGKNAQEFIETPEGVVPGPAHVAPSGEVDEEDFFIACAEGDLAKVLNLIALGANVNAKDEEGTSVYQVAKEEGHNEVCALLKMNGAQG